MRIIIGFFMMFSLYYLNQFGHVSATSANTIDNHRPRNPRPFVRVPVGRPAIQYARFKQEPFNDFIVDDDDLFELSKRQTSDDYGHLRFGKRGEDSFDDYGHMRFGRSGNSEK